MREQCQVLIAPRERFGFLHQYQCKKPAIGELNGRRACKFHIAMDERTRKGWKEREQREHEAYERRKAERRMVEQYPALLAAARAVVKAWNYGPPGATEKKIDALAALLPPAASGGEGEM